MTTRIAILTIAIMVVVFDVPTVRASAPAFDDVVAVPLPWSQYGYRSAMGDFVTLNDGSVVMSYTEPLGEHKGRIAAVKSYDKGKTWGQPYTMLEPYAGTDGAGYCHPSFLRLDNGEILLSYIRANFVVTPYVSGNLIRRSSDEGQTWSAPTIQSTAPGNPSQQYDGVAHIHNDRMQILSTGRIIAMAERKDYHLSRFSHNGYVGMAYYSDDQGYTWQPGTGVVDMYPIEVQEADVVELKSGRLMMFARSYDAHPVCAYSDDFGETWLGGQLMTELSMPYCGFTTVRRIPSTDDLLFIWPGEANLINGVPTRSSLNCAISQDEGNTFTHYQKIVGDPQWDYGQQAIEFLDDGTALLGYHTNDGLHVAKIPTDWFYEVVPEPGALALLLTGLFTMAAHGWRQRK